MKMVNSFAVCDPKEGAAGSRHWHRTLYSHCARLDMEKWEDRQLDNSLDN